MLGRKVRGKFCPRRHVQARTARRPREDPANSVRKIRGAGVGLLHHPRISGGTRRGCLPRTSVEALSRSSQVKQKKTNENVNSNYAYTLLAGIITAPSQKKLQKILLPPPTLTSTFSPASPPLTFRLHPAPFPRFCPYKFPRFNWL